MNARFKDMEVSTAAAPASWRPRWLAAASIVACAPMFACATGEAPAERVDKTSSAWATNVIDVVAGTANRKVQYVCGQTCTQWRYFPPLKPGMTGGAGCVAYADDCFHTRPTSASLYADDTDLANDVVFPAYDEGATAHYDGCGPAAAQNILNYYGVQMTVDDVAQHISTFAWEAGNPNSPGGIATWPDDLASGLQDLLNTYAGGGTYVVERHSDPALFRDTIDSEILHGNPVIVLVQGGAHFQVVTGFRDYWTYHVIDYPWNSNDSWISEFELGVTMDLPYSAAFGANGEQDYTYITIHFTPY